MPAIVVKRFVGGFTGTQRYSIRQHSNGTFQIYHDNPFEGVPQPYQYDDQPLSGLYADAESAEAELLRMKVL
jgi:hypothetical protein